MAVGNAVKDLTVSFNLKVNGVAANDFAHVAGVRVWVYDSVGDYGVLDEGNSQPQATVVAHNTSTGAMAGIRVNNQACMNCHGDRVFQGLDAFVVPTGHHGANPVGVEGCVICHDRDNAETRLGGLGTRLMGYVHGIHNSHNMPGAVSTSDAVIAGGLYYRNGGATSTFSIGFPGYMNNCSTCHTSAASTPTGPGTSRRASPPPAPR